MTCENFLCVYEKNGECIFESVEHDILGTCKDCIYVTIDAETLAELKKKTLISLGDYDLYNDFE